MAIMGPVGAEAERRAAEADLQPPDELFRAVIEGSQDAIFVKDRDGRYRLINSAGALYLGHSVEEALGRTDAELVDERTARFSVETDRAVIASGEPIVYERFSAFNGLDRCFVTTKGPWRDAKGAVVGVFGVARDITARKRIEEELRQTGELLSAMLQSSPLAMIQLDRELRVTEWNPAAERLFGWSREEAVGKPPPFRTPQVDAEFRSLWEGVLRGGSVDGVEVRRPRRDGAMLDLLLWIATVRDSAGEVSGLLGLYADDTERHRIEQERAALLGAERLARRAAEEAGRRLARIHSLTAALSAAATPADVARAVLEVGVPAAGASGGTLYEVSGDALLLVGQSGHSPDMEERIRRIPLSRAVAPVEVVRTGEPIFLRSRAEASALLPESAPELSMSANAAWAGMPLLVDGRAAGVLFFSFTQERDFSDAERAELLTLGRQCAQALQRARLLETAQQAVRQRDEVLAVVSHDLRNMVGVFRVAAALLSREVPEGADRAPARGGALERQADGMGRLVDDLVDVARIDAGSFRIVPADCDGRALAQDAVAAVQPLAQQKAIALSLLLPDAPAPVDCDRARILQVFANVLGNAVKFTDRGEVRLEVAPAGREVRFSISDSGGGISTEHLPHLFERYWQARPGERSRAGVGPYIARDIVQGHGGPHLGGSAP